MKFATFFVTAILSFGLSAATALPADAEADLLARDTEFDARAPAPKCNPRDKSKAKQFLRAFNPKVVDHFYTTNRNEYQNAVKNLGYKNEGSAGRIFTKTQRGAVPFYRAYSPKGTDHFYTTNLQERNNAVDNLGYQGEGIAGYIYPTRLCGSVPFYRTYNPKTIDHFYTTSFQERNNAISKLGYQDEGIAGYIFRN